MPHTYAHLGQWLDATRDGGSTDLLTGTTASDIAQRAAILKDLEAASRSVDAYCDRSRFGSGFGPRIASNKYDARTASHLDLDDDFLTISGVTVYAGTGGASSSLTEDTDYYTQPYGRAQKRRLTIHGLTSVTFTPGLRTATVAGTAGYSNDSFTATATAGAISSTTVTTFTVGGTDDLHMGMTLLIDTEQLYLRGKNSTTATIKRAQNGTTAATHSGSAAIAYYLYPDDVIQATLLIAQRRRRMRDAGLTGSFSGEGMGTTSHADSELSILNRTVGYLRIYGAG